MFEIEFIKCRVIYCKSLYLFLFQRFNCLCLSWVCILSEPFSLGSEQFLQQGIMIRNCDLLYGVVKHKVAHHVLSCHFNDGC